MNKYGNVKIIEKIKLILFFAYILVFYMFGADSNKVIYSEIILLVIMGLEVLDIIKNKKIKYCIPILVVFVFAFYCFLSNFWAIIDPQLSIATSKRIFILAIFLLILYNFFIKIENTEEKLLKIIMYAGIAFSFYVIMYYGIGNYINKLMLGERVGEEINNVNAIGLQTSISVIIAIFFALYKNKISYYLLTILPVIVSLGTGSRKVIILLVLGTILLFLLKREDKINIKNILKKIIIFLIIVIVFINVSKMPMFSTVFQRLERTINTFTGNGKVDGSTIERNLFVRAGIDQFLENPILGIGIANSGYITNKVAGWTTYLHNNYVELLSTTGIIGFSLYYFAYFYIIINCLKAIRKRNKYINVVLVIFLINLVLEYAYVSYYDKSTYVYLLLGLITIERARKDNLNEKV